MDNKTNLDTSMAQKKEVFDNMVAIAMKKKKEFRDEEQKGHEEVSLVQARNPADESSIPIAEMPLTTKTRDEVKESYEPAFWHVFNLDEEEEKKSEANGSDDDDRGAEGSVPLLPLKE